MSIVALKKERGFSLFELLIVLTIIAILSAVIYPNYTRTLIKTRRTEAKIALLQIADRMEHYYFNNHYSYANVSFAKLGVKEKTDNNFYTLSLKSTNHTYELTATATFSDPECYRLILNERGKKTSANHMRGCW